jgi:hypothetical protein
MAVYRNPVQYVISVNRFSWDHSERGAKSGYILLFTLEYLTRSAYRDYTELKSDFFV